MSGARIRSGEEDRENDGGGVVRGDVEGRWGRSRRKMKRRGRMR